MARQKQRSPERVSTSKGWTIRLLVVGLFTLALAGCSRGSYPLDFFNEMHYQQSYRTQEPLTTSAPADSVPTTGREVDVDISQAGTLRNPLPNDAATSALGARLYRVNCAVCHGETGQGDGPLANQLKEAGYLAPPSNLTSQGPTKGKSDGELFILVTKGFAGAYGLPEGRFVMPPFGKLLTAHERWAIVQYMRDLQQ